MVTDRGGTREGRWAAIRAEDGRWRGGEHNEYRVTIAQDNSPSRYQSVDYDNIFPLGLFSMRGAGVLTAAVEAALDCLSNPAMLEDWNFEGCEATIEADRPADDE